VQYDGLARPGTSHLVLYVDRLAVEPQRKRSRAAHAHPKLRNLADQQLTVEVEGTFALAVIIAGQVNTEVVWLYYRHTKRVRIVGAVAGNRTYLLDAEEVGVAVDAVVVHVARRRHRRQAVVGVSGVEGQQRGVIVDKRSQQQPRAIARETPRQRTCGLPVDGYVDQVRVGQVGLRYGRHGKGQYLRRVGGHCPYCGLYHLGSHARPYRQRYLLGIFL
jgi:hypothetical protein